MDLNKVTESSKTRKTNPKLKANFLSKLFFCWTIPLFLKGYRKDLDENDMYNNLNGLNSSRLGGRLEDKWNIELNRKGKPSLIRVLFKLFGWELALYGIIPFFNELIVRVSQPIFLKELLSYYEPNQTRVTLNEAYIYASMIILASFLNVISVHYNVMGLQQLGMKFRISCCSLIYRKALKLSKKGLDEDSVGQIVNILATDVRRFDVTLMHLHQIWIAPLLVILTVYLIYTNLGLTALAGIILFILLMPLQLFLGKRISHYRMQTAIKTDYRVRLTNEIINGIQVIKMYSWEKPFVKLIEMSRIAEIKQIRANSYIRAINTSFSMFINRTAIFLSILAFVFTNDHLSAQYVFVMSSYYGMLRQTLTMMLPMLVTTMAETNVAIKRIQKFLLADELTISTLIDHKINNLKSIPMTELNGVSKFKDVGVSLQNITACWSSNFSVKNINFEAKPNQLIGIVGTVGSGKSTLFHVILHELPYAEGTLRVDGEISYSSQEPWLFDGTIRQNILFGQNYDEIRYHKVIKMCALQRDLSILPHGDKTLVGERGTMLSGGQKTRINLARAVYKEADIYLLDDPLSAVDTNVGRQIFDKCISNHLSNKCTILITHQLQYLKEVDRIYLMENGTITASGTYQELQANNEKFTKLLVEESTNETDEANIKKVRSERSICRTQSEASEDDHEEAVQVKEQQSTGQISKRVYMTYLQTGGNAFGVSLLTIVFIAAQLVGSGCDYFLTFWVNLEQYRWETNTTINELVNTTTEDTGLSDFFVTHFTTDTCIYVYTVIILLVVTFTITRSLAFLQFCLKASFKLYSKMFKAVLHAPMRFFNVNPTGRILNRFSKDIGMIDEMLPMVITDTIQIGLQVIGTIIIISFINVWILLPSCLVLVIFYFLRSFFLATSRDIKRLEGVTRSPVFTHLTSSVQGLTTIRAFGAQGILQQEFDKHQDLHSSVFYMFHACNRSFGLWLDMHCVAYIALVTLSFLVMGKETYAGNVGLVITQAIGLTGMFQWGMRQWSELENQMTSVERVVEYTEIDPEKDDGKKTPAKLWPEYGKIEFRNINLRYDTNEPLVLKNLNFTIQPNEKIGIVGRTGAGKSSMIATLFRLVNFDGSVLIDDVDTKEISLNLLRSSISIIPQEPVLFSGTIRRNLDPFDAYDDELLWDALRSVELKTTVESLPAGLHSKVSEGGANFSIGQRQLICLARAVISKNKILLLDEATANVDSHTDKLIQITIKERFDECTVLTIAHRLHTIMDSDRILVMDNGCAVEFDHAHTLLQNKQSVFYSLVEQTGKGMSENLVRIAEKNFSGEQ